MMPDGPANAPAAAACTRGATRAVSELACELARGLGALGAGTVVAAAPDQGGARSDRFAELSTRMARETARALGGGATALSGAPTLPDARARAHGGSHLVWIGISSLGGEVRVHAEVRSVTVGFWDRVRGVRDVARITVSATRALDGELSAVVPQPPLVTSRIDDVLRGRPDAVALACTTAAGDPSLHVVMVGRHRVQAGRIAGSAYQKTAEVPWTALSPVAAAPLREPIATAESTPSGSYRIGSTDREHGLILSPTLERVGVLAAPLPARFVGCLSRTGTAAGHALPCAPGEGPDIDVGDVAIDAVASGFAVKPDGTVRRVAAFRTPGGVLTARDDAGRAGTAPSVGAALAVADLDRDGIPEIIASENTDVPDSDAVVVRSFDEAGALTERLRVPMPEGVQALAACPADSPAHAAIVVATRAGLRVIR